jgi:hypothetical protein
MMYGTHATTLFPASMFLRHGGLIGLLTGGLLRRFLWGWWAESDGSDYVGADGVRRSTVRGGPLPHSRMVRVDRRAKPWP